MAKITGELNHKHKEDDVKYVGNLNMNNYEVLRRSSEGSELINDDSRLIEVQKS